MRFRSTVLALFTAASAGACTQAAASPAQAPRVPVVVYMHELSGQTANAPIDLVQTIFTFAPGAQSIVHEHLAPNLATVLQGHIVVHTPTGDVEADADQVLFEPIDQAVQAANMVAGVTMVAGSFPVPHGTKPTAPVAGQPVPPLLNKTLYTYTLASPAISGGYAVIQQELKFAPGAQSRKHRHGGPGVVTVLQGAVTVVTDGVSATYTAGQTFIELPGQTLQVSNHGGSQALVVATFLLPDGAKLTTNL